MTTVAAGLPRARPAGSDDARRARGEAILCRLTWRLGPGMCAANTIGAVGVFLFLAYVLPLGDNVEAASKHHAVTLNLIAFLCYSFVAALVGWLVSAGRFRPIRRWLRAGSEYDEKLRSYVVRHPLRQTLVHGAIWAASEAVFIPINAPYGLYPTLDIASGIALGGISTCGITYFVAERLLRPLNEMVLGDSTVPDPYVPGVKTRLIAAWALGTGVPIIGIAMLVLDRGDRELSAGSVLFLAVIGLVAGSLAMGFAARSVADPVESVTAALNAVESGDLDVTVPVYDGSQVGRLQSGFNGMVEGLREREQLRDLFGRQVGRDVAEQALAQGADFTGQSLHVAVLFVDVIGSMELTGQRSPTEVVAALNEFFGIVVDVVGRTGGFVNKFEGDAALCLYGAPVPREDAETCALVAARELRERLGQVRGLSAGIGVAAGQVIAGNMGTAERYEYTVIGDAVNSAARVTELAKQYPELLVVTGEALAGAKAEERQRWRVVDEVTLRGRSAPTSLAVPV